MIFLSSIIFWKIIFWFFQEIKKLITMSILNYLVKIEVIEKKEKLSIIHMKKKVINLIVNLFRVILKTVIIQVHKDKDLKIRDKEKNKDLMKMKIVLRIKAVIPNINIIIKKIDNLINQILMIKIQNKILKIE